MTDKFDPYAELGVGRDATIDEINSAWKDAAKRTHPDKGGDPKEFLRASRALTILRDPEKRRRYDTHGDADETLDHTTADALTIIANLMEQMLLDDSGIPTHLDLVKVWSDCVSLAKREMQKEIAQLAEAERRSERIIKRFRRKRPLPANLVQRMMADVTNNFATQRGRALLKLAAYDKAMELLKDYQFEADAPAEPDARLRRIMGGEFFSVRTE